MRLMRISLLLPLALLTLTAVRGYEPPIGIPNPADYFEGFDPIDAPKPNPVTYAPGWYAATPRANAKAFGDANDCYYVDNAHPNATDTSNSYGHPGKPRMTIPNIVFSAGAYIEIHGGGGTQRYGEAFRPGGVGTSDKPIWFVGVDDPVLTAVCNIGFSSFSEIAYLVFHGISWKQGGKLDLRPRYDNNRFKNIVFRNCTFRGEASTLDGSGVLVGGASNSPIRTTSNVVFYRCEVSHYGDKNAPREECGVYPKFNVTNLWFLDGSVHDNAEDGFGGSHGGERTSTGYYIGRNEIYNNLTDPIDIKGMGVVVVSENNIHGHQDVWVDGVHKSSGTGAGVTFHYSGDSTGPGFWDNFPEDCSLLFNTITGGRSALGTSCTGRLRVVGNVITATRHKPSNYTDTPYAIDLRGLRGDTWIAFNTIYDSEGGIRIWDTPGLYDGSAVYYKAYVCMYDGKSWVCTDDNSGAGIKGITPDNRMFWQEFRVQIIGNILSNRPTQGYADIRIDNAMFGNGSVVMDYNLVFHPVWGGGFQYGSATVRDLGWIQANTTHQTKGISQDPQFVNPSAGDFRLYSASPAIDAVTDSQAALIYEDYLARFGINIFVDRNRTARPYSGAFDAGAFEAKTGTVTSPSAPTGLTVGSAQF